MSGYLVRGNPLSGHRWSALGANASSLKLGKGEAEVKIDETAKYCPTISVTDGIDSRTTSFLQSVRWCGLFESAVCRVCDMCGAVLSCESHRLWISVGQSDLVNKQLARPLPKPSTTLQRLRGKPPRSRANPYPKTALPPPPHTPKLWVFQHSALAREGTI